MKASSRQREWSLATRLSRWIVVFTILPVLLALTAGYVFLEYQIARELTALVDEELEESVLSLRRCDSPQQEFPAIAAELAGLHPSVKLAWRLFDPQGKTVLAEYGDRSILTKASPSSTCLKQIQDLGNGLLTKSIVAPQGLILGLVLDGSGHVAVVTWYGVVGIGVGLISIVLAFVASRILVRKVTLLLDRVATSVSTPPEDFDPNAELEGAPKEIRQIAESLHRVLRAVRRESEEARVFTMSLAHELRSPVQNLIGQAEVALLKSRDPKAYEALLASQLEELNELADALDNLLLIFSTPAATNGHAESANGHFEHFNLGGETRLRIAREQRRGQREGVSLALNTKGNTKMAGDREAVLRGLRNVVANALNWSPQGGNVQVTIDGTGDDIVVTVDDAGPGVPVGIRDQVFSPFFQGQQRQAGRIGYGLGLAMAHKAITSHGGTVEIDSSPAGGARFVITMPRAPAGPDAATDARDRGVATPVAARWRTRRAQ